MTATARPAKQDRTTMMLLLVAALVAVGGIGFALGHLTAPGSSAAANPTGARGGFGRPQPPVPGSGPDVRREPVRRRRRRTRRPRRRGRRCHRNGPVDHRHRPLRFRRRTARALRSICPGAPRITVRRRPSAGDVKVGTSVIVQIDTSALASETPNPSASGGPRRSDSDGQGRPDHNSVGVPRCICSSSRTTSASAAS